MIRRLCWKSGKLFAVVGSLQRYCRGWRRVGRFCENWHSDSRRGGSWAPSGCASGAGEDLGRRCRLHADNRSFHYSWRAPTGPWPAAHIPGTLAPVVRTGSLAQTLASPRLSTDGRSSSPDGT